MVIQTQIENYWVFLNIDSSRLTYTGVVKIAVIGSDGKFFLNSVDLSIHSVKINGSSVNYKTVQDQQSIIPEGIKPGDFYAEIEFSGTIPHLLTGLYLAKSRNGNIFTTQFESTGARRMFPCVDHPNFKATFDISVEADENMDVISNMPVFSENRNAGRKITTFGRTPKMSTYLLYLGIGKFDTRSIKRKNMEIILAAPEGLLTKSQFPLEIASGVLDLFEEYFGIDYVLPKVHLISVPEFSAGAMENWGAITFREIYLGIDDSTSSSSFKSTGEVIAHELAHQWFGNLVTMEWWNDLWLNESFATFMSYRILSVMKPEWDTLGDMILLRTDAALKNDALRNSHPIDAEVKNPDDIAQIFDEISYGKGASILRMVEGYVGKENFRKGISNYLQKYQYGNAKGSYLWNSIQEASGLPVSRIMSDWIRKKGYPVLTARFQDGEVVISQNQFLLGGGRTDEMWSIPLTVKRTSGTESVLMDGRDTQIKLDGFIKLNDSFSGFYRTNYDDTLFAVLIGQLDRMTNLDLWGIANDLYSFLQSGTYDLKTYFDRLKPLWKSTDPLVIMEISGQLSSLYLLNPDSSLISRVIPEFCVPHLARLGDKVPGEPINVSIARSSLSYTLSLVDRDHATALASRFSDYFSLDPDIRGQVANAFARLKSDFQALREKFMECSTDEDRTRIISAMAWIPNEADLSGAMDMIRDGTIKRQDTWRFYSSCASSPTSRDFLFNHFDIMVRQLREIFVGTRTPARVIELTAPIIGLGRESEMKQMLQTYTTQDLQIGIKKSIELLGINSRLSKLLK